MSSLGPPPCCCLNCFNTAIQYVNLAVLTLKKTPPLEPWPLNSLLLLRTGQAKRNSHRGHIQPVPESGCWGVLGDPCQKQSRFEVILLSRSLRSPHSDLRLGDLWRKHEGSKAPWRGFLPWVSLSESPNPLHLSDRKGRSHGRRTAMPVQPLLAEREGPECYSLRTGVIFWTTSHAS